MGRALPWLAASFIVWAIVCSTACGLSGLDGFSAGGPLAPDSSLDGATPDAAVTEGGIDGAGEGDASTALTCPPNAFVCDDFEHAGSLAERWDVFGAPKVSTKEAVSAGHSLELSMVEDQNAPVLTRDFTVPTPGGFDRTELSFDVYAGAKPGSFLELCKLALGPTNDWDSLVVSIDDRGLNADLQDYVNSSGPTESTSQNIVPAAQFYGQGWYHVDVKTDLSGTTKTAVFTVNGVPQTHSLTNGHGSPEAARLFVGFSYGNTTIDGVFVDNVVFAPQ